MDTHLIKHTNSVRRASTNSRLGIDEYYIPGIHAKDIKAYRAAPTTIYISAETDDWRLSLTYYVYSGLESRDIIMWVDAGVLYIKCPPEVNKFEPHVIPLVDVTEMVRVG